MKRGRACLTPTSTIALGIADTRAPGNAECTRRITKIAVHRITLNLVLVFAHVSVTILLASFLSELYIAS